MKKTQLHYFVYLAKSGGLLLLASFLHRVDFFIPYVTDEANMFVGYSNIFTTIMYVCMLFAWGRKVYIRVVSQRIQAYTISCVVMMMLWFVFRIIKYTSNNVILGRYMWYLYYLPIVFLPLMSLHIALTLRNPDSKKSIRKYHLLDIVAFILFAMVMTNQLTGAVFEHFDSQGRHDIYSHNWGYYVIVVWIVLISVLTIVLILRESRIFFEGFYFFYPIGLMILAAIYTVIYFISQYYLHVTPFIDMTPFFCWVFCAIWEFLITAGLVPTNRYYVDFFNESSLSAYIADADGNVMYESQNALPLSKEEFDSLLDRGKLTWVEGREAYIYSMKNEYVVYENDTSEIVEMIEELEDTREELMGETFIRQKANEAEAARIRIEEKEYLFGKLTGATKSQLRRIRENMSKINSTDEETEKNLWKEIVILGTYVKRYSNLLLLKEGDLQISAIELQLSLQQSMENLKLMGVNTGMMIRNEGTIDIENILQCYELFESVVEWDLYGLRGVHVMFSKRDEQCTFLIEAEGERGFEDFDFFEYDGKLDIEAEDNTISATLIWKNRVRGGADSAV